MTWTRIPDDFYDAPDLASVPRSARLLHVEALVYCNRHGTDGALPAGMVRRICDDPEAEKLVEQLVEIGRWRVTERGWQLDWSEQEAAEEVKARQQYRADTQKRYRERKARHERGDHSMCDPRFCKSAVIGNETGNATGNKNGDKTPSRPVPSRPKAGTGSQGRWPDVAGAPSAAPAGVHPQLAIGDHERDQMTPSASPWDLHLESHPCDETHTEVSVQLLLDGTVANGHSVSDFDQARRWFDGIATVIYDHIQGDFAALAERHGCGGKDSWDNCAASRAEDAGSESDFVSAIVPNALADQWLDRMRGLLGTLVLDVHDGSSPPLRLVNEGTGR